jgi:hypothetical protein
VLKGRDYRRRRGGRGRMESYKGGKESSIYVGDGALELFTTAQIGKVALSSETSSVSRIGKVAIERVQNRESSNRQLQNHQ